MIIQPFIPDEHFIEDSFSAYEFDIDLRCLLISQRKITCDRFRERVLYTDYIGNVATKFMPIYYVEDGIFYEVREQTVIHQHGITTNEQLFVDLYREHPELTIKQMLELAAL